jgi:hypothetical protein
MYLNPVVVIGPVDLCEKPLNPYKIDTFLSTIACGKLVEKLPLMWKILLSEVFLKSLLAGAVLSCGKNSICIVTSFISTIYKPVGCGRSVEILCVPFVCQITLTVAKIID